MKIIFFPSRYINSEAEMLSHLDKRPSESLTLGDGNAKFIPRRTSTPPSFIPTHIARSDPNAHAPAQSKSKSTGGKR
jgi:hypothetical protein